MNSKLLPYGTTQTQDAKDRLLTWTRDAATTPLDAQSWDLTFEHNWEETTTTDASTDTVESRTFNAVHELLSVDPDDTGPTSPATLTYDPKGNLAADGGAPGMPGTGRTFSHDFDNRMDEVVVPVGSAVGTPGNHTYKYDALGRRVSKSINGGTATIFVQSGGQVLAEYEAGTAPSAGALRKYVYGVYIDEPLALIDNTAAGSEAAGTEETFFYHRNRQYTIIGLTDDSGAVVERYAYTAYGDPIILAPNGTTIRSTSDFGNAYLHTGRRFDFESGLYYYRARMYDAKLGRFLERDPLGYPDGLNSYVAFHVSRNALDPFGKEYIYPDANGGYTTNPSESDYTPHDDPTGNPLSDSTIPVGAITVIDPNTGKTYYTTDGGKSFTGIDVNGRHYKLSYKSAHRLQTRLHAQYTNMVSVFDLTPVCPEPGFSRPKPEDGFLSYGWSRPSDLKFGIDIISLYAGMKSLESHGLDFDSFQTYADLTAVTSSGIGIANDIIMVQLVSAKGLDDAVLVFKSSKFLKFAPGISLLSDGVTIGYGGYEAGMLAYEAGSVLFGDSYYCGDQFSFSGTGRFTVDFTTEYNLWEDTQESYLGGTVGEIGEDLSVGSNSARILIREYGYRVYIIEYWNAAKPEIGF